MRRRWIRIGIMSQRGAAVTQLRRLTFSVVFSKKRTDIFGCVQAGFGADVGENTGVI